MRRSRDLLDAAVAQESNLASIGQLRGNEDLLEITRFRGERDFDFHPFECPNLVRLKVASFEQLAE